jgi:hypothetical protein
VPLTAKATALPRWLWLAVLAVTLMAPAMLGPLRLNDSHWINYSWTEQFTAAIAHGDIWPRWLAQSHGGLGAPDFYFYGPVTFWLAAVFGLTGLAPWPSLLCTATLASWVSGLAMARLCTGRTRHPGLAAALYMALPYHLLDFYLRGALAEFVAYAPLPLIALAIRDRLIGRLAASYALLILTHLPTALLASLFLIPPLIIVKARRDGSALLPLIAGLVGGLMLAAPYLLPAIILQPFAAITTMTGTPALKASHWAILSNDWRIQEGLFLVELICAASVLPVLILLPRDGLGWLTLAWIGLALGLPPFLWDFPLLSRVQFPWRMLVMVDFGLAVMIARSVLPIERLLLLATPALALTAIVLVLPTANTSVPLLNLLRTSHPDVIEYLPAGTTEPYAAYSHRALRLAAVTPPSHSAAGWTTVRLHYFPIWQVRCANGVVPSSAEPKTGLLRYRGAGCAIEQRRPLVERIGILLAILSIFLLAAHAAYGRGKGLLTPTG